MAIVLRASRPRGPWRRERDATVAYILNQEEHHKRESSADELRRLLEECGIDYAPRFFE